MPAGSPTAAENVLDGYTPLRSSAQEDAVLSPRRRAAKWLDRGGTGPLIAAVLIVGVSCGVVAYAYNAILQLFLKLVWDVLPAHVVTPAFHWASDTVPWLSEHAWVLGFYIVLIATSFGFVVGASQRILGCPGDLPETIGNFHKQGCIPYSQVRLWLECACTSARPASASRSLKLPSLSCSNPFYGLQVRQHV